MHFCAKMGGELRRGRCDRVVGFPFFVTLAAVLSGATVGSGELSNATGSSAASLTPRVRSSDGQPPKNCWTCFEVDLAPPRLQSRPLRAHYRLLCSHGGPLDQNGPYAAFFLNDTFVLPRRALCTSPQPPLPRPPAPSPPPARPPPPYLPPPPIPPPSPPLQPAAAGVAYAYDGPSLVAAASDPTVLTFVLIRDISLNGQHVQISRPGKPVTVSGIDPHCDTSRPLAAGGCPTIDTQGRSRAFAVTAAASATFRGLSIVNGAAGGAGGCLSSEAPATSVWNVRFDSCTAGAEGGAAAMGAPGQRADIRGVSAANCFATGVRSR